MNELKGEWREIHNRRIERLWRDVWNYVCSQFYYIFQFLDVEG